MTSILRHIDLQRLAGVKRILGIDISGGRARIVELARRGNPITRYGARFVPASAFTMNIPRDASPRDKGEAIREELALRKIRTKAAVSSIRTAGIKTVAATVPQGTEDVVEWIRDHQEILLKLPVSPVDVSFRFEILEKDKSGLQAEITFVRNSDIEEHKSIFHAAGLDLISLGAGVQELLSSLVVGMPGDFRRNVALVHVGDGIVTIMPLRGGKRDTARTVQVQGNEELENIIAGSLQSDRFEGGESTAPTVVMTGDSSGDFPYSKYKALTPFGLEAHYALAAGLALKGFVPELSPCDFLPAGEQTEVVNRRFRALAQRTAVLCGSIVVVLLGLQLMASVYLQKRIDVLDERLAASGPEYTEVAILEREVASLESRLEGGSSSLQRTNTARVLHEIASAAPEGVWLAKILLDGKGTSKIRLIGFATSNDQVARFLRNLERESVFLEPNFVRAGVPGEQDRVLSASNQPAGTTVFELTAGVKL